jgi:arylsulfatase A-like enzyme
MLKRIIYLIILLVIFSCEKNNNRPNIVFILTDDLGYGDLSSYGSETINTINIDKLAEDGVKLTSYYAAQPVCSASRAAILTGVYPNRIGIYNAFGPTSDSGINSNEYTLAEMLKDNGYETGIFGKWHLGSKKEFFPTNHGFDEFYGILYSNDMWRWHPENPEGYPQDLLLYRNENPLKEIIDQSNLTKDITTESINFIEKNKDNSFFLYIAHPQPHVPLFVSEDFEDLTGNGLYADVITEIDYSVGRVLDKIEESGLTENTIVVFTSDNGPWLSYGDHAGSSGIYREGKGTTWEGGVRVPSIIKFTNGLKPSIIDEPVMAIDWMPTFANITRSKLSQNKIDGKDIWPLLSGEVKQTPHQELYFYHRVNELHSIRMNNWKIQFSRTYRSLNGRAGGKDGIPVKYDMNLIEKNELYNLKDDPQEKINVYDSFPEIAKKMEELGDKARIKLGDNLMGIKGKENRGE